MDRRDIKAGRTGACDDVAEIDDRAWAAVDGAQAEIVEHTTTKSTIAADDPGGARVDGANARLECRGQEGRKGSHQDHEVGAAMASKVEWWVRDQRRSTRRRRLSGKGREKRWRSGKAQRRSVMATARDGTAR